MSGHNQARRVTVPVSRPPMGDGRRFGKWEAYEETRECRGESVGTFRPQSPPRVYRSRDRDAKDARPGEEGRDPSGWREAWLRDVDNPPHGYLTSEQREKQRSQSPVYWVPEGPAFASTAPPPPAPHPEPHGTSQGPRAPPSPPRVVQGYAPPVVPAAPRSVAAVAAPTPTPHGTPMRAEGRGVDAASPAVFVTGGHDAEPQGGAVFQQIEAGPPEAGHVVFHHEHAPAPVVRASGKAEGYVDVVSKVKPEAPALLRVRVKGDLRRLPMSAIKGCLEATTGVPANQQVLEKEGFFLSDAVLGGAVNLVSGSVLVLTLAPAPGAGRVVEALPHHHQTHQTHQTTNHIIVSPPVGSSHPHEPVTTTVRTFYYTPPGGAHT